ncbi:unnamed protein product [Bubo scandiacus]
MSEMHKNHLRGKGCKSVAYLHTPASRLTVQNHSLKPPISVPPVNRYVRALSQVAKEKETLSIVPSSGPTTVPSLACLYKLKGPQEGKCTRAHYPSSTVSLSASS